MSSWRHFITKKELEASAILCVPFYLKPVQIEEFLKKTWSENKRMLRRQQKSEKYAVRGEMNTVKNQKSVCCLVILTHFLS